MHFEIDIDYLLKNSYEESLLKKYLIKMEKIVGEDYTVITLSSLQDIKESLMIFTSKFNKAESIGLASALIKSYILSQTEENVYTQIIDKYLENDRINELISTVNNNYGIRKTLTRIMIRQAKIPNRKLFNEKKNKKEIIKGLISLQDYEKIMKRDKYFNNYKKTYHRKKGK